MRKWLLLIYLVFLFSIHASAQKQNVYLLKNDGTKVSTKDSADFIRIVSEPDSGTTLFNINEYYKNGKPKLIGKTSSIYGDNLEDKCILFYTSGKRRQIANYQKGVLAGDVYNYFPNGKLYNIIFYPSVNGLDAVFDPSKGAIFKSSYDSTGKALTIDGNGHFINYDKDFITVLDEGDVKDGLKTGTWKGYVKTDTLTFTEIYEDNKLICGESMDKAGKVYKYISQQVPPAFEGGEQAFGKFLLHNVRYPEYAKTHHVQGMVFISFVVNTDGSLINFKILRDPGGGLGGEALRILTLSPKWQPGIKYGRLTSIQYTVPINFSLANN